MKQREEKNKVLYVIGEVAEDISFEFISELVETEWEKENITELHIYIVSEGGFLRDCLAVIDIVQHIRKEKNIKVVTHGLGEIASAGFFLFLLGDERWLSPNCRAFVHEHITLGEEKTYSERLKADKTDEKALYNSYVKFTAERLGLSPTKAKNLLKKNKWLSKKEIETYNICTGYYDE